MNNDHFASNIVSLTMAWVFFVPILFGAIVSAFSLFEKKDGVPWIFTAWVAVCFLLLSPLRYMLFQVITATSYSFQSWSALLSTFYLGIIILVPLAFSILFLLGFSLPFVLVMVVVGSEKSPWWRYCIASIAAPIFAFRGQLFFGYCYQAL